MARNQKIKIMKDDKIVSFRKFKAMSKEELLARAVAKRQLINSGIFTYSQLKKLVEKKVLNEIIFDDDIYFEKSEVFAYLQNRI